MILHELQKSEFDSISLLYLRVSEAVITYRFWNCYPFLGYEFSALTGQCEDIDECTKSSYSVCGLDSECQNSYGSYRCTCKPGFKLRDDSRW